MGIVMTKLTDPVINPVNYVSDLARPGEGAVFSYSRIDRLYSQFLWITLWMKCGEVSQIPIFAVLLLN
jgi:hypothetical protein